MSNTFIIAELSANHAGKKNIAKDTLLREKDFNKNAGLTSAYDRLAEFFYEEENPDVSTVFDVKDEDIKKVHDF